MSLLKGAILDEDFEPALGKSIRATLAFILPLLWGMATDHLYAAVWIALGSQILSFVEVKGSYPVKLLVMSGTVLACGLAGILGVLTGNNPGLATVLMFILAFLGGFVRQSGAHGPSVTIGVLLIFLLGLNQAGGWNDALNMFYWVVSGGILAVLFTFISWAFIPFSPFRRSVAYVWKALSDWIDLMHTLVATGASDHRPVDALDEKELLFRQELNDSTEMLSRQQAVSHAKRNRLTYQLIELRRLVSFSASSISVLRDILEEHRRESDFPLRIVSYILDNLSRGSRQIAKAIITNRTSDVYSVSLSLERIRSNLGLLKQDLSKDSTNLIRNQLVDTVEELDRYFEEAHYYLDKMIPKSKQMTFFVRNFITGMTIPQKIPRVRFVFNKKSFTFRFALRLALVMALSVALYKFFQIHKGYWIAMTAMIILQPELGATLQKSGNRMIGTILGAVVGSFIFIFPISLGWTFLLVTLSSFLMMYYIEHNYSVGVFFITLMVVSLYGLIEPADWQLGLTRVLNTLGGAVLALIGGYAFFPLWQRYRFPVLLKKAILSASDYYSTVMVSIDTRKTMTNMDFVKPRRDAEIANSNAFHSLRAMGSEPQNKFINRYLLYTILGYNIRLVRVIKALNQELIKNIDSFRFNNRIELKKMIEMVLKSAAEKISSSEEASKKEAVPLEEIVRKTNEIVNQIPDDHTDLKLLKTYLNRVTREAVGLSFSIARSKKEWVKK